MSTKFCGLTVVDFSTTLGLDESQSQMSIRLVMDDGDFNLIPPVGYPVWFSYGALTFNGILQKVEEDISTGGLTFNVNVVDAKEILRNVSVVTGGYNGSVVSIRNIINVYGYQERLGFGGSGSSSSGMPWFLVKEGIEKICNVPYSGPYGGPINYKGVSYSIDMSQIPGMSGLYKVPGNSSNLFDIISTVCRDAGVNFFVTLNGYSIVINCIPKNRMIPKGVLRNWIEEVSLTSQVVNRGSFGMEDAQGEVTEALLIGGEKEDLYQTGDIKSFWGYDYKGNPIYGDPGYFFWVPIKGKIAPYNQYDFYESKKTFYQTDKNDKKPRSFILKYNPELGSTPRSVFEPPDPQYPTVLTLEEYNRYSYGYILGNIEVANLNSTVVSDVVRSLVYPCSTLEMRMALSGLDDWEEFIMKVRPDVYELIYNFKPEWVDNINKDAPNNADMVEDSPQKIKKDLASAQQDESYLRLTKLFSFVRHYAEDFYGKKFACSIPIIASKIDPDSQQLVNAADIVQSAYKPEGSNPLNISSLNSTFFTDENGKYYAFCRVPAVGTVLDQSGGSVVQDDYIYIRVQVEPQILAGRTYMAAVFSLSSPVQKEPNGIFGELEVIAAIKKMNKKAFTTTFPAFADFENLSPERVYPKGVAIPLKSNVERYGPFWVTGSPGKSEYIQDDSLVPWNFGGYEAMNVYATAQLAMIKSFNQYIESGQVNVAGIPIMNLGGLLKGAGPALTDISCNISSKGMTTQYTFRVFTPRAGAVPRQFADRLRSVSINGVRIRRDLKNAIKESLALRQIVRDNRQSIKFQELIKKELRRNTPSDIIVCNMYEPSLEDEDNSKDRRIYSQITNLKEALTMISSNNDDKYRFNTVMSLNGIFVPFSLKSDDAHKVMPRTPVIAQFSSDIVTSESFNHFNNGSIDVVGRSKKYDGVKYKTGLNIKDLKPVGLRGPVWISGYGPNLKNLNGFNTDSTSAKPKNWMVGPVDLIFDNYRGVWSPHTTYLCKSTTEITAANNFKTNPSPTSLGSGSVQILADSPTNSHFLKDSDGQNAILTCKNPYSKSIPIDSLVMVGYNPHYNCFVVVGADCI